MYHSSYLPHALRLAPDFVLLWGEVRFALPENAEIFWNGSSIAPPYPGLLFDTPAAENYVLLLRDGRFAEVAALSGMTIKPAGVPAAVLPEYSLSEDAGTLAEWLNTLENAHRQALWSFLVKASMHYPSLQDSRVLTEMLRALHLRLKTKQLPLLQSFWLAPHLLYLEALVGDTWPCADARILTLGSSRCAVAKTHLFQIEEKKCAVFAQFESPLYTGAHHAFELTLISDNAAPLLLHGIAETRAFGLEWVQALNAKPAYQKHLIREAVSRALLDGGGETAALLSKLQCFVQAETQTLIDPSLPFNLHFDHVIPIGDEGIFVQGWMRDPYGMLAQIEAISALGFSFPVQEHLFRYPRPDVAESFRHSAYGGFQEEQGFVAFVPMSEAVKTRLSGKALLHEFRFRARLGNGAVFDVTPPAQFRDEVAVRSFVLACVPPEFVSEAMIERCLGPAASALQRLCMHKVAVKETARFGREVRSPKVSLVIPLYRRLEFVKIQLALFADDPAMRVAEIIYVLDSPEQEAQVRAMLADLSLLYGLPVTLVVMRRNAGYAAATNAGAALARAPYLVLLNSDVIPRTPGWTETMAAFYAEHTGIGALGAKLLYEDDSLQHAGMYFARGAFPFWLNHHFYKGYPRDFAPARESRAVPAVTGACLMIDRALYERIGGLTTDYVIGDFEDSDLCLKCASRGLENWYCAEAELYHLERQSVPLNEAYHGNLAWRYNARLHSERWEKWIEKLMQAQELLAA